MRLRTEPLGWGLSIGAGAVLASFVGAYLPGWGAALAPAAATLVFAVGTHRVPEDALLAWTLRVTVALTIGFLATTVPVTLARLAESEEAALEARDLLNAVSLEEARATLRAMWSVMGSMVPVGILALASRARRLGRSRTP
jgi:hypothetical protein